MSNGEICCLLGICCPPEAQHAAVMRLMHRFGIDDDTKCCEIADWWVEHINVVSILKAIGERLSA